MSNDPGQLLVLLMQFLLDGTYIPAAATGVVAITNVFKFLLVRVGLEPSNLVQVLIALGVQFAVWVAWMAFTRAGRIDQFTQWYNGIVTVILALFPLFGGVFVASKLYQSAKGAAELVEVEDGVVIAQSVTKGSNSWVVPILGYSVGEDE